MNYPQLSGEPNFVLIGVSAVFGLLVIIIVYYIFISKKSNIQSQNYSTMATMSNLMSNQNLQSSSPTKNNSPVSINNNYASIPTSAPVATLSNPTLNQVYNIRENIYTLDDAPGVCGALGSDVATINQLIDAHKTGADWCNVGWTKDGLAAYPIQYSTWKTLQDNEPNKRNMCGTPGINLVRNDKDLLYGVNCYGIKPEPKQGEKVKQLIQSDAQIALQLKIAQFQKNMNKIGIAPFNQNAWSGQ